MNHIKHVLNTSPVFSKLGEDDVQRLGLLFEKWDIQPGDILASEKDEVQHFFLLNTGTLLLGMDDGRSVVLSTPGDFVGLELLSVKGVCTTTVTVLEKGSVFAIPGQVFLAFIQEDSDAASAIMESWQEYLDLRASFVKNA